MGRPASAVVTPHSLLGRLHLATGLIGLFVFLGSGLYMDRSLAHLVGMEDAPRALYRSGHIYILFGALLHLTLGSYVTARDAAIGRVLQYVASLALFAALTLFVYGFVVETPLGLVERPVTRAAIELALAGTLLHAMTAALFKSGVAAATAQAAAAGESAAGSLTIG